MKILIFADNGKGIGLGHLSRCLSLSYKLIELDHDTLLILKKDEGYQLEKKCSKLKIEQIRFSEKKILQIQKQFNPDLFIVDSYNFRHNFLLQIKKNSLTVGFDDFSKFDLAFDIIINISPTAKKIDYNKFKFLLLGEKYQIIKRDILNTNYYKFNKKVKNLIILTGGDDYKKVTNKICNYLNHSPILLKNKIICNFIVGPYSNISIDISNYKNINFHFDPKNLTDLMSKADLAITASGQTLYELCYLGVPSIAFLAGEDQKLNMNSLSKKNVIFQIGDSTSKKFIFKLNIALIKMIDDFKMRKILSEKSKNLIDGLGSERISNELQNVITKKSEVNNEL